MYEQKCMKKGRSATAVTELPMNQKGAKARAPSLDFIFCCN